MTALKCRRQASDFGFEEEDDDWLEADVQAPLLTLKLGRLSAKTGSTKVWIPKYDWDACYKGPCQDLSNRDPETADSLHIRCSKAGRTN